MDAGLEGVVTPQVDKSGMEGNRNRFNQGALAVDSKAVG